MNLKYFRSIAAISCIVIAATFVAKAEPLSYFNSEFVYQSNKPGTHTVARGETVYSIARQYGLGVSDVYLANPGVKSGIKVGDVLTIPSQTLTAQYSSNAARTYTVHSKETLYSIAKQYDVRVEDIIDANPALKDRPLYEGQILRIPSSGQPLSPVTPSIKPQRGNTKFISHKVEPKETLYAISNQYKVTPEAIIDFNPDLKDGLKIGATIIIPILDAPTDRSTTLLDNVNNVNVGIVLPFVNKSDGQSARFVEYYEGFLLALEKMKAQGLSANIYTFDMGSETGTDKLKSLLDTYEMKSLDLIIGGISPQQIAVLSDFAKKERIKYVVPFPTKINEELTNPEVFQVNVSHSVLYENTAKIFANLFPKANIIYITENGNKGDKSDFINTLNTQLLRGGMVATSVNAGSNLKTELSAVLDPNRKNVIVPTSASAKMLGIVLPILQTVSAEHPAIDLSLFGYVDWLTYRQYSKDYGRFDTYIFTPFYFNENDSRSQQFVYNYKKWYKKSMINTYPKYAVLGYDTGISFLGALQKYGNNFDSNTNSLSNSSLQTPFLFKKEDSASSYMNNGFYIVHYKADGSIDKTEYGR